MEQQHQSFLWPEPPLQMQDTGKVVNLLEVVFLMAAMTKWQQQIYWQQVLLVEAHV